MLHVLRRHLTQQTPPEPREAAAQVVVEAKLLSKVDVDGFNDNGYLALPAILTQEEQDDLRADVDRMEADRKLHRDQKTPAPFIVEYDKLGKLCSHPAIVDRVKELMKAYVTPDGSPGNGETNIAMHHIHASRQDEGTGGVHWHQDYHSATDCHDRDQLMVHVFFYFNGLNGTVGDLLALPGLAQPLVELYGGCVVVLKV